jgi:hypothetical protein
MPTHNANGDLSTISRELTCNACQLRSHTCPNQESCTHACSLNKMNARTRPNAHGLITLRLQLTYSGRTSAIHTVLNKTTWPLLPTVAAWLRLNALLNRSALSETLRINFHKDHSAELAMLFHTQNSSWSASAWLMRLNATPTQLDFANGMITATWLKSEAAKLSLTKLLSNHSAKPCKRPTDSNLMNVNGTMETTRTLLNQVITLPNQETIPLNQ